MKILLLAVSVIAVFTADSREVPGDPNGGDSVESQNIPNEPSSNQFADSAQSFDKEPVIQTSEFEEQQFLDGPESNTEEPQLSNSPEEDHQYMEKGSGPNERVLRDSQCKENVICGLLGGACMANTTVCSGWLVSEGCQGTTCKCCIPGSLEIKMKNFGLELQSMKDDLANSSMQQTRRLESMIENITNTNAGLKGQIQSFTDSKINASSNFESQLNNLTQTNLKLQQELDSIKADVSKKLCPKGMFWFAPTGQCFKFLSTKYTWATANSQCQAQGLELAKPFDPVSLRIYLMAKYDLNDRTWLGAKGTGSYMKWQHGGNVMSSSNHLWYSGSVPTGSSLCACLMTYDSVAKGSPTKPLYYNSCSIKYWTLCELIRE